jgi:non-ribosomal peptide synthase protein (TIGR01720 family)
MLLEGPATLASAHLQQAIEHLLLHHDVLRMRFRLEEGHWQQFYSPPGPNIPFQTIDISALSEAEQRRFVQQTASQQQASLHLENGPLLRFTYFYRGESQPCKLFIVIHHLLIDTVSWNILLDDLQTACAQLFRKEHISLGPKTTAFKQWAELLQEYARAPRILAETAYWLEEDRTNVKPLPRDFPVTGNATGKEESARTITAVLMEEETRRLQDAAQSYRAANNEVVLTALVLALSRWTDEPGILVALEGHGREELSDGLDFSRSLGWYTNLFPVLVRTERADEPGACLQLIKEQLRTVPEHGMSYGLARYLHPDAALIERLRSLPVPEVLFNYLGRIDYTSGPESMFKQVSEESGFDHHPENARSYLFEINACILADRLEINWSYSHQAYHERTVRTLLEDTVGYLRSLIAHRWPAEEMVAPSDFPLAKLNRQKLQMVSRLLEQIEDKHEKR